MGQETEMQSKVVYTKVLEAMITDKPRSPPWISTHRLSKREKQSIFVLDKIVS